MKKYICALLCGILALSLACPVFASEPELTTEAAGARLREMGVYQGNATGDLMLEKGLSRAELAAILTRLHGEGKVDPNQYAWACYFDDVPEWARPYVGYCTATLLVKGYGNGTYGPNDPVTPAAACTVVFRVCGFGDGEGEAWTYYTACDYAVKLGLISGATARADAITRGDMAVLLCLAIQKEGQTPPPEQPPAQAESITYAADGTITSKTITQAAWSREDFSQEANPAVFTGFYTREWYNAIRQTIVDQETILAGNDADDFNAGYLYAHTLAPNQPEEAFDAFCYVLARISGAYYYSLGAEPYTKNQYEYPGYTIIKVDTILHTDELVRLIQPELSALEGKSDREKVVVFNDYLCDRIAYGKNDQCTLQSIFSPHTEPVYGVCANYSSAFSFLCDAAGIPCVVITSEDHVWNEVYVDEQWLTVDVTFNDGSFNRDAYLLSTMAAREDIMPQSTDFAQELLVPGSTKE